MSVTPEDAVMDRGWEIANRKHLDIYEKAKPFLQTRFNALHTRISYHFAATLLPTTGGDPRVVFPAILLHDIGWHMIPEARQAGAFGPKVKHPERQRLHETEGARMAGEILGGMKYPAPQIREIQDIISGHDTRPDALNPSDAVVKDADKLWRYSYEGFAIDTRRFNTSPHEHLIWLIESIPRWFLTEAAKTLAHQATLQRKTDFGVVLD